MDKIYVASAGSGKTSLLIDLVGKEANSDLKGKSVAIVTYTVNNQENIKQRLSDSNYLLPRNVKVMGWYKFLLDYWIKPFKGCIIPSLYEHHISGIARVEGSSDVKGFRSGKFARIHNKKRNIAEYYITSDNFVYSDKLNEFAYDCYNKNRDALVRRLSSIFSSIYIDEGQDLSDWDFEIISIIAKSKAPNLYIFCDPRQRTYSTSSGQKNKKYNGRPDLYAKCKINAPRQFFIYIDYSSLMYTHRSVEEICSYANTIFPEEPESHACACSKCIAIRQEFKLPKGIFLLRDKDEQEYISMYEPVSLIWDDRFHNRVKTSNFYSFGASKGIEFDSTIIYPTSSLIDFISKKKKLSSYAVKSKFYVAVTRAKFTCAIVVPDNFDKGSSELPFWNGKME